GRVGRREPDRPLLVGWAGARWKRARPTRQPPMRSRVGLPRLRRGPAHPTKRNGVPAVTPNNPFAPLSRREMLRRIGGGFGAVGLAGVLAGETRAEAPPPGPLAPKPGHFPARAKRVIFLFMNGG